MSCIIPIGTPPTDPIGGASASVFADQQGAGAGSANANAPYTGRFFPDGGGGTGSSSISADYTIEKLANGDVKVVMNIEARSNSTGVLTPDIDVDSGMGGFGGGANVNINIGGGNLALNGISGSPVFPLVYNFDGSSPFEDVHTWTVIAITADPTNAVDATTHNFVAIDARLEVGGGTLKNDGGTSLIASKWYAQNLNVQQLSCAFGESLPSGNVTIDVGLALCDIQLIQANTSDVNVTLNSANISDCNRNRIWIKNTGTQNVIVLPSTGTIDGVASYTLTPNQSALFYWDANLTKWLVMTNKN